MILSDTAEYALRATLYIAQHADAELPLRTEDVSEALQVPQNYLSKILHTLAKRGILSSTRGPRGGFRLRPDPESLPLYRVIEPFDDLEPRRTCLLGRAQCSDRNPCPAHDLWKGISDQVGGFLRTTTVADLLRQKGTLTP